MLSYLKVVSSGFSRSQRIVVMFAAVMLAACDSDPQAAGASPREDQLQVLRIQEDPERNRLWLLDPDAVSLYDNRSGKLLQRIVLPGWIHFGRQFGCPPDLALDPSGAVFVTSNVLPVLWRIDPVQLEVTVLDIALDADHDKTSGSPDWRSPRRNFHRDQCDPRHCGRSIACLERPKLASYAPVRGACEPCSSRSRSTTDHAFHASMI